MDASSNVQFERLGVDGRIDAIERPIASEVPVAIEVNGIGYAVLMATPADLIDLAWGFALAERLIEGAGEVVDCLVHEQANGILVRLTLVAAAAARAVERVRHRVSESSCGLCGIENLEQAIRPLPRVTAGFAGDAGAVFAALAALRDHQPLNRATGAVHVAAACSAAGDIRLVREDVGRHNGFDKLIGAMLRSGMEWDGGFALLTSRCSYELVEKAALAKCPLLATISAPTALAVARAGEVRLLGAVLAGGEARRFGSDKALAAWRGRALIEHVVAGLAPQVETVIVCGREHPGLVGVPDRPAAGLGPLGGIAAALHHAALQRFDAVLTVPCDAPVLPGDLAERLAGSGFLAGTPVVGVWPSVLAARLDAYLAAGGDRSVRRWAKAVGVPAVEGALVNVNRPEDLAALDPLPEGDEP